jgi:hypothetical protein
MNPVRRGLENPSIRRTDRIAAASFPISDPCCTSLQTPFPSQADFFGLIRTQSSVVYPFHPALKLHPDARVCAQPLKFWQQNNGGARGRVSVGSPGTTLDFKPRQRFEVTIELGFLLQRFQLHNNRQHFRQMILQILLAQFFVQDSQQFILLLQRKAHVMR